MQQMQHQLGRQISIHHGRFMVGGWQWYLGGVAILGFLTALSRGEWWYALGSLVVGGLLLLYAVSQWRQTFEVFENGFVWQKLVGTTKVAKDEVLGASLTTHTSRQGTYQEVVIALRDGSELSVEGLADLEQIRNYLNAWANPQSPAMNVAGAWSPPGQAGWSPPGQAGWPPSGESGGAAAQAGWSPTGQDARAAAPSWGPPPQGAGAAPQVGRSPVGQGAGAGWAPPGQGWNRGGPGGKP